jgi:hypothetical protein
LRPSRRFTFDGYAGKGHAPQTYSSSTPVAVAETLAIEFSETQGTGCSLNGWARNNVVVLGLRLAHPVATRVREAGRSVAEIWRGIRTAKTEVPPASRPGITDAVQALTISVAGCVEGLALAERWWRGRSRGRFFLAVLVVFASLGGGVRQPEQPRSSSEGDNERLPPGASRRECTGKGIKAVVIHRTVLQHRLRAAVEARRQDDAESHRRL